MNLMFMKEKKKIEKVNKEYSDIDYERDMNEIIKDKKVKFMKENFQSMFERINYYLYSILPKKNFI